MVGLALAVAAPAVAQGVDETCVLPLTKTDAATVNVAFPDQAAVYWVGAYTMVPGTRLRITGRYPHARYFSFNVYDNLQRPLDAIADAEIRPDPGSTNPFLPGADRTAGHRDYTVFVDFGPKPARPVDRASNTVYTGTGQNGAPNAQGTFILRIYVPDHGRDETGGVGLPTVTLEPTSSSERPAASPCSGLAKPSIGGVNDLVAGSNGLPALDPATIWGRKPPVWRKFQNLFVTAIDGFDTEDSQDLYHQLAPLRQLAVAQGGSGGFLSNIHNAYLSTAINRRYGRVLAVRFRAPTFPDTRPGPLTMPTGQVRYFSMCENEFFTQRFIGCATDDQTARDSDGFATYVISTPADRPRNARLRCGLTWIPWGPVAEGALIYRNMLPNPGFTQSIQMATAGGEAATMGDYFPTSRYFANRRAVERFGCANAGARLLARRRT